MKEFRQNMAKISDDAYKKRYRLVVLRKNRPMFTITPLSKKDAFLEELLYRREKGRADLKAGRTYSQEDIEKMLGL